MQEEFAAREAPIASLGRTRLPALALILLLLAAAGCGGAGEEGHRLPPQREGGEKSIEDFGAEALGAQRGALLDAFHEYLGAIATADPVAACSRLAARVRHSLRQFASGHLRREGCAVILPRLLAPTAVAVARGQEAGRVTRVRVAGNRAFVVFHAPGAKRYQLNLVREAGRWRAATLTASILVPSAATLAG